MVKKILSLLLVLLLTVGMVVGCSSNQSASNSTGKKAEYPIKSIEVVVPFSAGGGSDLTARTFSQIITEEKLLPVNLTVVNKPGGSAAIGMSYTAAKRGDPYYLMLITPSFLTTPLQGGVGVSYKDFTPIALLGFDEWFIVAKQGGKYETIKELIETAKQNPGTVTIGGASAGSGEHILAARIADTAGVEFNYVPFAGGSDLATAILGGHIDCGILNISEAADFVEAGQLVALVTPGADRFEKFPEVPTLVESGVDVVFAMPRGVVAPGDIPPETIEILGETFKQLSESERWKTEYVDKFLFSLDYKGPEETAKYFEETTAMYEEYLVKLGIIK